MLFAALQDRKTSYEIFRSRTAVCSHWREGSSPRTGLRCEGTSLCSGQAPTKSRRVCGSPFLISTVHKARGKGGPAFRYTVNLVVPTPASLPTSPSPLLRVPADRSRTAATYPVRAQGTEPRSTRSKRFARLAGRSVPATAPGSR